MSRTLKERVKEEMERRGYTVGIGEIEEVRNARDVQTLIYELEAKEYELPGPIEKFYLIKTAEDEIVCKVPVIDGEIEEELVVECNEEVEFENDDYDDEDLSDPDNPFSDEF